MAMVPLEVAHLGVFKGKTKYNNFTILAFRVFK